MKKELIRTDKNGTRYYHCIDHCMKCGGTGIIGYYIPVNGGECFDCGGSGISEWEEKEYTPEYEVKLQAQREKRAEKKLAKEREQATEKNAEFFEKNGFNADGKTYFVLGNTYAIKEELKAQGAKWDNVSRHWHMAVKPEGLKTFEVSVEEMYRADAAGIYDWHNWIGFAEIHDKGLIHYSDRIDKAEQELKASESTSEHVGEIGDKLEIVVTYTHTASWENSFGYRASLTYLHTFKDEQGNVFTWKTGNCIEADYDTKMKITGTIKEHGDYKGIKQTVLTRCKVKEVR